MPIERELNEPQYNECEFCGEQVNENEKACEFCIAEQKADFNED